MMRITHFTKILPFHKILRGTDKRIDAISMAYFIKFITVHAHKYIGSG